MARLSNDPFPCSTEGRHCAAVAGATGRGGASTLVDDLLDEGYTKVTVLDLSEAALAASQSRLGMRGVNVTWLVGDLTNVDLLQHFLRRVV